MGKRTAAEADVFERDHDHDATVGSPLSSSSATTAFAACATSGDATRALLESPVPFAWRRIPDRSCVEPRGACHTRVRAAARGAKQSKLPLAPGRRRGDNSSNSSSENDDDDARDDMSELTMALPPLVAPRPRRVVSPDLLFQHPPSITTSHCRLHEPEGVETAEDNDPARSLRWRPAFRPIGAGRPDVEITSPPARARNPVVLDARFKNMQRLDLALDARDAPLQPFHRPCAQRRVVTNGPMVLHAPSPVGFAKVVPLAMDATTTRTTTEAAW